VAIGGISSQTVWVVGTAGATPVVPGALAVNRLPAFPGGKDTATGSIAVGNDGSPWVATSDNSIFHGDPQTGIWTQLQGLARDIAVTSDGTVWVVGTLQTTGGYHIYFWNGSAWVQVNGAATRIAGGPGDGGQPWVVNSSQNIYHRNADGSWTLWSGAGYDIAVDYVNGTPWTLGTENGAGAPHPIYHFTASRGWLKDADPNFPGAWVITGGSNPSCSQPYFIDADKNLRILQTSSVF